MASSKKPPVGGSKSAAPAPAPYPPVPAQVAAPVAPAPNCPAGCAAWQPVYPNSHRAVSRDPFIAPRRIRRLANTFSRNTSFRFVLTP